MPTPTGPKLIRVKTTTTAYAGEYVKITNLTRGGTIKVALNSDGEAVVNPSDESQSWNTGDTVQAEIHGRLQGYASGTFTKSGVTLTMNDAADTATPAVDL